MTAAASALTAFAGATTAISVGTAALVSGIVGGTFILGTTVAAAIQQASINNHHQPKEFNGR
jgi:hypothetical protein